MISLIVAGIGAIVAVVATGVLASRAARSPSAFLIAWAVAAFGLAVSLGAQLLGAVSGYGALTFRAMELGGLAIAPVVRRPKIKL